MSLTPDELHNAFTQTRQRLRNYLRRHLPQAELADDVLQDVFIKALRARQEGRQIGNLAAWLFATTRTTLVDYLRAHANTTAALDDNLPMDETQDLQPHHQLAQCLRPFIDQLPPLYRDTLTATDLRSMSMRSLAEAQGVSVSAIKSRAARGRAMLKAAVLDCCQVEMENGIVIDYRKRAPL